jgi:hypothetical protein
MATPLEGMSHEQWQTLIGLLSDISSNLTLKTYTLTGAVDWYWIVVLAVALSAWLGYIHQDLKSHIIRQESLVKEERVDREKNDALIWAALDKCQEKCHNRRAGD